VASGDVWIYYATAIIITMFILMPYIFTPLVAHRKYRNWLGWFALAFFLNWIALILILILKDQTPVSGQKCPNPHCRANVSRDRETCHRCGVRL